MLAQQPNQLQHIIFTEGHIPAEGHGSQGQLPVALLPDVKPILSEHIQVLPHNLHFPWGQVQDLGMQQGLPVQDGGCSQAFKIVLLIRRVLINDEQILA